MAYLLLGFFGLCFGSFVNALVWRLHEQTKAKSKTKKAELSITKGRSMCPHCKHILVTKDLVPVLSWASLGGKCRYCKKPISWQYPVVELLVGLLFIVAYAATTDALGAISLHSVRFGVFLIAIVVGMALAVYDLKWMLLPNRLVVILAALGIVFASLSLISVENLVHSLTSAIFAVLIAGGVFYVLFQVSDGKWIGGGDVKLGLALGLFLLNAQNALLMLFIASALGCLYALVMVIIGKYKKGIRIPFGPALLLATYIVVLFGDKLVHYYQNLILLG